MSIEAVAIALHHSKARGTARLVLIGVANHDSDGGAWPSVKTLAKYAAVTPRNVQKALRDLEALGEIRTLKQQGGPREMRDEARPNLYEFLLACPPECDHSKKHRIRPPVASDTRGDDATDTRGTSDPTPKPSDEPPVEPSSWSGDAGTSSDATGIAHPAARTKRKGRRGPPPSGVSEDDQADFASLKDVCQEIGQEDPISVWWTLRKDHGAWEPSRFLRDQVSRGTWDGFVGRHGINGYEPSGKVA